MSVYHLLTLLYKLSFSTVIDIIDIYRFVPTMQDNEYNCNIKLAHQSPTKSDIIEYIQDDEKSEKLNMF